MSLLSKGIIYCVYEAVGGDTVLLSEVKSNDIRMHSSILREAKSEKMCLAGVGSYWLVTGEKLKIKQDKKLPLRKSVPLPTTDTALNLLQHDTSRATQSLRSDLSELNGGGLKHITFSSATRLSVGFSPVSSGYEELARSLLTNGYITVPLHHSIDAVEIRENLWIVDEQRRGEGGQYRLSRYFDFRRVPTVRLLDPSSAVRLPSGIVILPPGSCWSEAKIIDLRTDEEILKSVEDWVGRIRTSTGEETTSLNALTDVIGHIRRHTISVDERQDLEAISMILASRQEILSTVPQILSKTTAWNAAAEEFRKAEFGRLSDEARQRVDRETKKLEAKLSELRQIIAEAEARLETISYREVNLRAESRAIQADIEAMIEKAARNVVASDAATASLMADDITRLRKEVEQINDRISTISTIGARPSEETVKEHQVSHVGPTMASAEQRAEQLKELAAVTGFKLPELITLVHWSRFTELPVIVGSASVRAAVDFCTLIGGNLAQIIFCDPTRISFEDLMGGGLATAIRVATDNSEVLVPVAFCNLTSSPCEFWLPQFMELRRMGRLPKNMACIGSAVQDGIRTQVPRSTLGYIVPFSPSGKPSGVSVEAFFGLSWPGDFPRDVQKQTSAYPALAASKTGVSNAPALLVRAATAVGTTLTSEDPPTEALVKCMEDRFRWLLSIENDQEHELFKAFQNTVG